MRTLVALRWPSSGRQILLSFVVAVILVFSTIALLKVNSGAKQGATRELLTGFIPTSPAVRKSPSNDPMATFLALNSNQPALQPMQRMLDRSTVPLPRPRPKRDEQFLHSICYLGHIGDRRIRIMELSDNDPAAIKILILA
jgi:hypothetical protein